MACPISRILVSWHRATPCIRSSRRSLPELCSRYGQHERTLFSFLTGAHRASAASFLVSTELPIRGRLPCLGLDAAYDYFVNSDGLAALSSGQSSRWTEITTRLRDAHGLSAKQSRLAKTIALLNLVSTTGTIRASSRVLALAETGVDALAALQKAGIVTYRDFADEYRIWQGTDVDIRRLLDGARQRAQQRSLVEILSDVHRPAPVCGGAAQRRTRRTPCVCQTLCGRWGAGATPRPVLAV